MITGGKFAYLKSRSVTYGYTSVKPLTLSWKTHLVSSHTPEGFTQLISGRRVIFRYIGLNFSSNPSGLTYQKSKPSLVCYFSKFSFKLSIDDIDLFILYVQLDLVSGEEGLRRKRSLNSRGQNASPKSRESFVSSIGSKWTYIGIILIKVLEGSFKLFQFGRRNVGMCS